MISSEQKKEAIRQYKERKPCIGIYAVRCAITGRVWVGSSRNLDATRNGIWFSLRSGAHREQALQQEWTAHGESAFRYEVLEKLKEDVATLLVADLLKARKQHWMTELNGAGLL
jgi:hypothetical protein